jgi:glycosyltransferase involved in cell wall biosynthesis
LALSYPENKVLFITYLFPPVGGGGVQRSSKFAKYLPHHGWKPLVLTVKEAYDFYLDETLLADIGDDIIIYRSVSIEPMKWIRKILKRKVEKENEQKINNKQNVRKSLKPGFLVKLKTYLLIPDNEILWLPFAIWKGVRIIKKERPQVIYSTAAPYTDHLIAFILAKIFNLPWVADFRDLWVDRANFPNNRFRLFVDTRLEKMILKNASSVVASTELIAKKFSEKVREQNYTVITNGFDEYDFKPIKKTRDSEKEFRVTYTGIFNKEQNPDNIFYAIREIIDEREDIKEKIKLRFVGQLDNPGDFENVNLFNKLKLGSISDIIPYKNHPGVIEEMNKATVLLLLVGVYPNNESIYTGKIFEYLRSGKPILAVVPTDGVAAELIRKTNSGIVVSNMDVDAIKEGIARLFDLFIKGRLSEQFKCKNIDQFDRKYLTGILAREFENLTGK